MMGRFLIVASALLIAAGRAPAQERPYDPTSAYKEEDIEGFTVLVNPEVARHEKEATAARKELEHQLREIVRDVPAGPLRALRSVRFWVEWEAKPGGAAEFHPSATWLREHGYNPEKAGGVEISNIRNFVDWSRRAQPRMVLHELAHAYHFRVLGERHRAIESAYKGAVEGKKYESVDYVLGGPKRAYALNDAKEYFAELTEAYFGKNDFYPFTREELREFDPAGFKVLQQVWGEPRGDEPKEKK